MSTIHNSRCGRFVVRVVNRSYIGPSQYIGRSCGRDRASVLANPRSLRAGWARGETLVHYRRELRAALDRRVARACWNGRELGTDERQAMRQEMNRLFGLLSETGEVVLRCFCAPEACHGDEIAAVLLETLDDRTTARSSATPALARAA